MKYVGEEVMRKVTSASPGTTVLLSAPVGSGKTTFCIRRLWIYCRMHKKRLLLVVNRSALRGQLRQAIFRQLNMKDVPMSDDKLLEVDGLTVTSYQCLQKIFKNNLNSSTIQIGAIKAWQFDYVVADEIHYLLVDSLFSPETGYMMRFPTVFPNAVRVYMSATLQPVRNLLLKMEEIRDLYEFCDEWDRKYLPYRYEQTGIRAMIEQETGRSLKREVLEIHAVEPDYSYFTPVLYGEEMKIDHLIKSRISMGDTGKWLVFVTSKKEGIELKKRLVKADITAAFVTADGEDALSPMEREDRDEMSLILQKGRFCSHVLLATSVIDNGVSITDRQVTHLVTTGYELIQAVQQAGRIRVKGRKQKVELFVCRHTAEYFNRCQYQIREKLRICGIFESPDREKRIEYLVHKKDNLLQDVVSQGMGSDWCVNPLARLALEYFLAELDDNKSRLQNDPNGFVTKALGWFDFSLSQSVDLLEQQKRQDIAELQQFLAENVGKEMGRESWMAFRQELRRLHESVVGERLCHGHLNRTIGKEKVEEILGCYQYVLESKGNAYKIVKMEV